MLPVSWAPPVVIANGGLIGPDTGQAHRERHLTRSLVHRVPSRGPVHRVWIRDHHPVDPAAGVVHCYHDPGEFCSVAVAEATDSNVAAVEGASPRSGCPRSTTTRLIVRSIATPPERRPRTGRAGVGRHDLRRRLPTGLAPRRYPMR